MKGLTIFQPTSDHTLWKESKGQTAMRTESTAAKRIRLDERDHVVIPLRERRKVKRSRYRALHNGLTHAQ